MFDNRLLQEISEDIKVLRLRSELTAIDESIARLDKLDRSWTVEPQDPPEWPVAERGDCLMDASPRVLTDEDLDPEKVKQTARRVERNYHTLQEHDERLTRLRRHSNATYQRVNVIESTVKNLVNFEDDSSFVQQNHTVCIFDLQNRIHKLERKLAKKKAKAKK